MGKNTLVYASIGIVIIAAGGAYYFSTQSKSEPAYPATPTEAPGMGVVGNATTDTDPFDVTITYTDDGYSPADITIQQGQRVRFLNASENTTWPASSLHPTHTLYPEKESTNCLGSSFDSCHDLTLGEFFDFTFNYPGTWRFHDHLHPYDTGSITVIETTTDAPQSAQ